ncbi:hypothetical protein [Carnobacterium maltaromaticum]|uniref:hypothetical protein n=1 Tax=Carnobacterium maltaromaticum TaxID=2751 RepID=UPI00295E6BB2|nr:hypothetical protein [Carnobacterium maltaromaticum]
MIEIRITLSIEFFFFKSSPKALDEEVIESLSIDLITWRIQFSSKETLNAVMDDLKLAQDYQLSSVPSLIIEGKYTIFGAQSLDKN